MNREEAIREARTIEAMKKGYTGLGGKFATIAKILGYPIIEQGSSMFSQSFLEDPFQITEETEIPTMEEEESVYEIGQAFDGMSYGINLTIILKHYQKEIICEYDGQKVYWEISGELEGYVPNSAWEERIEDIYRVAKERERLRRPFEKEKLIAQANKKRKELLDEFKSKWGLT